MVRRFLMVCLILTLAVAGSVFAQGSQTANISGTVTGPDGVALPGVTVTASSPTMMGERSAVSTETGEYIIRGLTPGTYSVKFNLEGMQTVERTVVASLGGTSRADAAMRLTGTAETITVTAEAASALETVTVGTNITDETVQSLPVVRTPVGIASLSGSVVTDRTPVAGQLSISGGMAYDNAMLVNGVNVQDPIFGTTNNLFIEDAILETQVLTSGISAEYGHFTGGVLNAITKSGGNDFSGSLRGDFTKPDWREETPYEQGFRGFDPNTGAERTRATPTPRVGAVGEVYSATLGGPIMRDRLWFFAAVRDQEDSSPASTPFSGNIARTIENRRLEGKLTGNITANHSLQASYIENPDKRTHEVQVAPLTLDAVGLNSVRENEGTTFSYNGVLTNNLFAEARYSEKTFGFRGLGGVGQALNESPIRSGTRFAGNIAGTFNSPYFDATDPEDRNNEQYFGALSYFLTTGLGSHDLKGGVERFTVTRTGGNSQTSTDYVYYTGYKVAGGQPVLENGRLIPIFEPGAGRSAIGWWVATRGAVLDTTTDSVFINDRWDVNPRVSLSLGARHEIVKSEATGGIQAVDTTTTVPRLGASFDPLANGKFKFDVTYAHYAGRYNPSILGRNSPVGNPALLYGYYDGPAGEGRNFAAGFDPANYVFYYASVPTGNQFVEEGLSSPLQKEFTISAGMALPRGGWSKLTLIDRNLTNVIEDFITFDQGCSQIVFEGVDAGCFDNVWLRNSDEPVREYRALQLQANYGILRNWTIEGNYTRQLRNHGNYEGEAGQTITQSPLGNRPEIQSPRENPEGRLSAYQRDRVRLWTTYDLGLGRAGNLTAGLIYRYDSPQTFSYTVATSRSAAQLAKNPGYSSAGNQTLFFGDRGAGEFKATSLFDIALSYGIPVFRSVEPWIKFDIRNALNDDTQIGWNTAIRCVSPVARTGCVTVAGAPLDDLGNPTTFTTQYTGSIFGTPTAATSYVVPREYFVSAGIRF
jgi:Carboxypeptidase regulatory-like domain